MRNETPFRTALEEIVLELQLRANKAKFKYELAKGSSHYADERLKDLEKEYNARQEVFVYAANIYNKLIENDESN